MFDSYLQRLYEAAEEDTYLVLASNFGFRNVAKKFFVNEWLWELGLLDKKITTKQTRKTDIDEILFDANGDRDQLITKVLTKSGITKKTIRAVFPDSTREKLKQVIPLSIKRIFNREYLDIKWEKTQAYFVSENLQGININLKGREPFGTVEPGEPYDRLREKIISELYHLKDPYTFEHVVEEVYRKEDLFRGGFLEAAPDIIFVPYDSNYFLDSNKRTCRLFIGSAKDEFPVYGTKDKNGIFIIFGPNIKQANKIADLSIFDVAPTIYHLFGIQEKDGMDGKVRTDIFADPES